MPPERRVDPGGRDGCRAPMPWDARAGHGWQHPPWLPFAPKADRLNVEQERDDPSSMLHLYRHLLAVRRSSDALRGGTLELFPEGTLPASVLGYQRRSADDERVVLLNFASTPATVEGLRERIIEVTSAAGTTTPGTVFDGTLGPDEALVLR